jgi:hypothetical protein
MNSNNNITGSIAALEELIDLNNFYSININPQSGQINLQGRFNDITAGFAREVNVTLIYEEDVKMLKGESSDGKLRIVLT